LLTPHPNKIPGYATACIHVCEVLAYIGQHFFQSALGKGEIAKGEVVPAHAITTYRGSVGVDPLFLNLGTEWKLVVSLTPQPLSLQRKNPITHWIGGLVCPVWLFCRRDKSLALDNTDCAVPAPLAGLVCMYISHAVVMRNITLVIIE